jgi:leucyl-tRNA synthetase
MPAPKYDYARIEPKWQEIWEAERVFEAGDEFLKPKYYALIEFPYPSGAGLHVGHPRSNTALDIIARKRRMEGYNVLFPIGWDAFGLPTENYAVKNKIHPKVVTAENVAVFKRQLKRLGFSFDWRREINTTDPGYYRWTQWIFLKLFEHGLAYKAEIPINWCPDCTIGLANEEVVAGVCERCGAEVHKRVKEQWMLKITDYAQKLLEGLDEVDYIERAKVLQRNWIGRSEGAEIDFPITNARSGEKLRVFTTRPDTVFGATYMVLAPEHPLLDRFRDHIVNWAEVEAYRDQAARKSDLERTELGKEKTGVEIKGLAALNPATGKEIPLWISDYVLVSYGTGAIMAVPGHDSRDWEFARKFGLPTVEVIQGGDIEEGAYTDTEAGIVVNSGFLNGLPVEEAIPRVTRWLEENGFGERKVNYKLRDWVFSRQRYWGEPIPLIRCEKCGWVPVPEKDLPVILPDVESYEPTETGESPLANIREWVETDCPECGGPGRRETDTMPNWAGSSWYFMRYVDPGNDQELAGKEKLDYWLPVDWYNGGMEHTTLHLLYSRFWYQFLHDIGVAPTREPYRKRTSHGMILGENHEKMSKSRGNVINPDNVVDNFGADTFRVYEMFIGAFDQDTAWSTQGVRGCHRFLYRVWGLLDFLTDDDGYSAEFEKSMHKTVKKVSLDYESMKFNTAVSALMSLVNEFYLAERVTRGEFRTFLVLLNPVAPHITEELWQIAGFAGALHAQEWVGWDEEKTVDEMVEVAVQVNGRVRDRMVVPAGTGEDGLREGALALERVLPHVKGKTVVKVVTVPDRLVNIVVK